MVAYVLCIFGIAVFAFYMSHILDIQRFLANVLSSGLLVLVHLRLVDCFSVVFDIVVLVVAVLEPHPPDFHLVYPPDLVVEYCLLYWFLFSVVGWSLRVLISFLV